VDPFEEVAVAGVALDPALSRAAGKGQRRPHGRRPIVDPDDLPDGPEAGELRRREVEHRGPMAVHAGRHVDDEIPASRLRLHGRDPGRRLGLVDLDAQATRTLDDPGEVGVAIKRNLEVLEMASDALVTRGLLTHGSLLGGQS
jgi:hypothetical protein